MCELKDREASEPEIGRRGLLSRPDGQVAAKPHKLLVQAVARSSKGAVAKYAWPAGNASACYG